MHTTVSSFENPRVLAHLARPATAAAEAVSQKTPSKRVRSPYASRISSSETMSMLPCYSRTASAAPCQLAGFPMRMAEAMVSGRSTTWPRTMGAAPSACQPTILGSDEIFPR